jgi:probable rRNA maturation factor
MKAQRRLQLTVQGREDFEGLPARATLRRWTSLALERNARIALRFVGTREGRALNRQFRGRDYATNVLTFDYESAPEVHADVVLCVPVIRREARQQGKSLRAHLAHLVIHGVLHAQGYDHQAPSETRRMEDRERRLLARLRITDPYREVSAN